MWIEKTPTGKYKACDRITDPITGKIKKISVTADKQRDAKALLKEKLDSLLTVPDNSDITFGDLCDKFLAYQKRHIRASSCVAWETRIRALKKCIGENALVNHLNANYVFEHLESNNPVTTKNRIKYFKTLIRWGYAHDYVQSKEWLDKIESIKDGSRQRIEDKYLEPDELQKLLDSMMRTHWRLLTKFLALSGLRIGEALALTMGDIDTHIHVTKTILINLHETGNTTKTADSYRDVFIQPELADTLREIRAWRLRWMLRKGIKSDLLFPALSYTSYKGYLAKKSAPIKHVTPHTLRHTHVSLLAAQGVSLDTISRRLGHSDTKITQDVYFHVTKKLKEEDERKIGSVRLL